MPRSKSIHFVTKDFNVTIPNEAQSNIFDGQLDLAYELSQQLGHEIRQGNTFRVIGMQATVRGATGYGDLDTGASIVVGSQYIPTTKHSRKAWNNVFQQWSKQKRLAGAVGAHIRYDDMECAWDSSTISSRTSTIHQDLADSIPESLCLTGNSTVNVDFSLEDYYNSAFALAPASLNHFNSSTYKEPKAGTTHYPPIQTIYTSATHSAMLDATTTPDSYGGAISMNNFQFFPADNHLNVMCGLMYLYGKILPVDTAAQTADNLKVTVTVAVEGWTPLVYRKKVMKRGRKGKRGYGRRRRSRK